MNVIEELYKAIDEMGFCNNCALCCKKEKAPRIWDFEIEKISKKLNMNKKRTKQRYTHTIKTNLDMEDTKVEVRVACLKMSEEGCPFLKDERCSIYDVRPTACRSFPFIDLGKRIMFSKDYCPAGISLFEGFYEYAKSLPDFPSIEESEEKETEDNVIIPIIGKRLLEDWLTHELC